MNKSNHQLFFDNHKELVENWYKKWIKQVRDSIPSDMKLSDEEIDSELTFQCCYLASIFKFGSYVAYCNAYVPKRVANAFWNDYRKLDHEALADAIDEFEDGYRDSYTVKHQRGHYEVSEFTTIDSEIENKDLTERIKNMAKDNFERQLINMILMGMTYDEISEIIGISKGTIAKRMKALGDRIKEKETQNA